MYLLVNTRINQWNLCISNNEQCDQTVDTQIFYCVTRRKVGLPKYMLNFMTSSLK